MLLSRELESGKISSVELTQEFLDRIKREDSKYNSFITVTEEQALADARGKAQEIAAETRAEIQKDVDAAMASGDEEDGEYGEEDDEDDEEDAALTYELVN